MIVTAKNGSGTKLTIVGYVSEGGFIPQTLAVCVSSWGSIYTLKLSELKDVKVVST